MEADTGDHTDDDHCQLSSFCVNKYTAALHQCRRYEITSCVPDQISGDEATCRAQLNCSKVDQIRYVRGDTALKSNGVKVKPYQWMLCHPNSGCFGTVALPHNKADKHGVRSA